MRSAPVPTEDYRRTGFQPPPPLLKGLDAAAGQVVGRYRRRAAVFQALRQTAEAVERQAPVWSELSEGAIRTRLEEIRATFRRHEQPAPEALVAGLAGVREMADRTLGLRPFHVQIMGALALHRGFLAEMATGEGKTLTAGLAATLAGWTRRPCHVVTVNDYLVERDANRLHPLYEACGVRAGFVVGEMEPAARRAGYAQDITYITSKELLADFLRDRLHLGRLQHPTRRLIRGLLHARPAEVEGLVMRGLHTAIVDEADSVLIDEAVTPLIISATHENPLLREVGQAAQTIVTGMERDVDYRANLRFKEIELTEAGLAKLAERASSLSGIWRGDSRRLEIAIQALAAREFFHRDKQYIISEGKVVIVDEFTGRPMPQRTWREGMHQAIEAKEGLEISDPSETIARLSFQRFFRCFHRLSGMSGTAIEEAGEFWQTYRLPVVRIPTNRPCLRQHWQDRIFLSGPEKWVAVVEEIERVHATGRPILIGTRSVEASENLAHQLRARHLPASVLNAIRIREESTIIGQAGERGGITIATNMAGRGTDILLGPGVSKLGGLHVIATERHESGRVDRQLFGRSGRQGDPGSAQAFVSLEDELILRHLQGGVGRLLRSAAERKLLGWQKAAGWGFQEAQRRAEKVGAKQRRGLMQVDSWLGEALSFAGEEFV